MDHDTSKQPLDNKHDDLETQSIHVDAVISAFKTKTERLQRSALCIKPS